MDCREAGRQSGSMPIPKNLRERIAAALRAARRAKKMTQEDLAALAGCSVETISNAERGVSLPGVELFLQLAVLLDMNLAALTDAPRGSRSKARLALEADVHQLARTLDDERLRLWLETGRLFSRD